MLLDIFDAARQGILTAQYIIVIVFAYAMIILVATPFHECSHAFVARLLGDDTAFMQGRVTLNPLAHYDPIGTTAILIVGIGWAKPVPVNPTRARKVTARTAMALTAAAGPISNVLLAIVFMVIGKLVLLIGLSGDNYETMYYVYNAFYTAASINVSLGIFNLLPIPPFDGSRIALVFLNEKTYFKIMRYEQYIMFGILLIVFTGILDYPLAFLRNAVMQFIDFITPIPLA